MLLPLNFNLLNLPNTNNDDVRIGDYIKQSSDCSSAAILSFNSDLGVELNNGRKGAATAPDLIRSAFYRMTPDPAVLKTYSEVLKCTADKGSIQANNLQLPEAQSLLGQATADLLRQQTTALILGGGHETSYGHFLGYVANNEPVTIINWDAHADVRELKDGAPHSGSPFRQALEHESGLCTSYIVAGLNRHATSAAHLKYLKDKIPGGRANYFFKGELNKHIIGHIYDRVQGSVMVTMDMDALSQSVAPGVSAPNPDGIALPLWLHAAYCAGLSPKVRSFDLVEMNPLYDIDSQTARIAGLTLWYFFKGRAQRKKSS